MDSLPIIAGAGATVIFAVSSLPMLAKAHRTRDLSSYSLGNIGLANLGNAVQSLYVFSLPPGPIWVLHTFYVVSTALMLWWYLRYRMGRPTHAVIGQVASIARRGRGLGVDTVISPEPEGDRHDHHPRRDRHRRCRPGRPGDGLLPAAARARVPGHRRRGAHR